MGKNSTQDKRHDHVEEIQQFTRDIKDVVMHFVFYSTDKHDKEKAEKERQKQIEKENAERLAREVKCSDFIF